MFAVYSEGYVKMNVPRLNGAGYAKYYVSTLKEQEPTWLV